MIGIAGRVAELLYPELNLGSRVEHLVVRLTHGVPGNAVDLARTPGGSLARGHYLRLARAHTKAHDLIVHRLQDLR